MQPNFAKLLTKAFSNERLTTYQQQLNHNSKLKLFNNYAWNMALSESLYSSLQVLEVTLRNSIHAAATLHLGCSDWYNQTRIISYHKDIKSLNTAKRTLKRQHKPFGPDRMIAELNFSFWTSLLDRRYEQVLWPGMLKQAFPNMPRHFRTRQVLSKRFHNARNLRNRIFHHEPIWASKNLSRQHQNILEAIAWIEPAAKDFVMSIDRFPEVYKAGPHDIELRLKQFC